MEYHLNYEDFVHITSNQLDKLICLTKGDLDFVLFRNEHKVYNSKNLILFIQSFYFDLILLEKRLVMKNLNT